MGIQDPVLQVDASLSLTAYSFPPTSTASGWVAPLAAAATQTQDFAFHLTQKGQRTDGQRSTLDYGSTPILKSHGRWRYITFQILAREHERNQINKSVLRFTGMIKDSEIELTREREESRSGGKQRGIVQSRYQADVFKTLKERLPPVFRFKKQSTELFRNCILWYSLALGSARRIPHDTRSS
jgi:hypothetical protein